MSLIKSMVNSLITLGILVCIFGSAIPVSAQAVIPEGATIDQAEFSVFADDAMGHTVYLHRITADWGENSVTWNSFMSSYDPIVIGSFTATFGWNTVDVTGLVQAWVDGDVPNFGILLKQGPTEFTRYFSSRYEFIDDRPKLEIWFTSPSGVADYVLIQRPGDAQDGVKDAHIMENSPDENGFYKERLFTGLLNGFDIQSLVQFFFDVESDAPGTGTSGYWKNHRVAWPVNRINIGGVTYTKRQAIRIMKSPVKGDKTKTMFKSLVAAKLNVMIGNDGSCIWPEIQAADQWLTDYPPGSGVKAGGSGSPWREGKPIHQMLGDYNKGLLSCADHRD